MYSNEAASTAFSTFINGWFRKTDLALLCREKGVKATGSKKFLVQECLQLYTSKELMKRSNVAQWLPWYGKLIIASLLQGGKSMKGIMTDKLTKATLGKQLPAAAFGVVMPMSGPRGTLSSEELKGYLARRAYRLKKRGIILLDKSKGIYNLNPLMTAYFTESLGSVSAEQLSKEVRNYASEVMRIGGQELSKLIASLEEHRTRQVSTTRKGWRVNLNRFHSMVEETQERIEAGQGELRFGVPFIKVSDISKQYYCEQKVELEYTLGKTETELMRVGGKAHESLLKDTVEIKLEEAWQDVFSGRPTMLREMLLIAKWKGLIIVGKADAVIFERGLPVCLFEYKFTSKGVPFRDMHVQARTYCYLLHEMGFNTRNLKYALVFADPKFSGNKELRLKLPWFVVRRATEYPQETVIKVGDMKAYTNRFNLSESESEIGWALEFWTGQRETKPTTKPAKCNVCEFRDQCPHAL